MNWFVGIILDGTGMSESSAKALRWIIIIITIVLLVFIPLELYDLTKWESFECYTCHTKLERAKDAQFLNMEWGARNSTTSYYTYVCYNCSHKGTMKEINDRKWLSYGYKAIS